MDTNTNTETVPNTSYSGAGASQPVIVPEEETEPERDPSAEDRRQEREGGDESATEGVLQPSPSCHLSYSDLENELRQGQNKAVILRGIACRLLPESEITEDYGLVGRCARNVGGWGRALQLLWELVPRPPSGEVFHYLLAAERKRGRAVEGQGTYYHPIAKAPYPGFTFTS